jgi:hypothetical protein
MRVTIVNASSLDIAGLGAPRFWSAKISSSLPGPLRYATLTREFDLWKYFSPAGEAAVSSVLLNGARELSAGLSNPSLINHTLTKVPPAPHMMG